ncbi:hypothetical protein KL906_003543 [Ogataea polymorpha]|uniref:Phytanoyl-CoA dioxygenase n=1 Tax=Ogataea polymorpha TaxID=460523 RepID=A0A9P8SZ12_9ASCO|nr:hypothetical protein KL906_003543 [Ogataea polymorpha]KAG7916709.1 hypothetical protein KL927_003348 [Ogataea polymorpha]KAH3659061.1 hypothetical protein OGATHE_006787 [Ogataea polymorpha]
MSATITEQPVKIQVSTKSVSTFKDTPGVDVKKTASVPNEVIEARSKTLFLNTHGDWRDDLVRDGYAVIKGAFSKEHAKKYQQEAFKWLKSFNNEKLDLENPETWTRENLPPVRADINVYSSYGVNHEKFLWDARMEPGVLEIFEKLWGTDQLLASFDGLNITLPNRKDQSRKSPWPHFDQSPFKGGLHCVQGILSFSEQGPNDGGLVVYRGTHKLFNEFFATQVRREDWDEFNYYEVSQEQLKWFMDRGCEEVKVNCEPGDVVIWDSRTCHWGMEPTEKSNVIRTVLYSCFTPAEFATDEALDRKKEIFEKWLGTTHWPHTDLVATSNHIPGQFDRTEPLTKPELSDKLLKLTGAKRY